MFLPVVKFYEDKNIDIEKIDKKLYGRLKHLAENKIRFISGTMSPTHQDIENNKLESVAQAFKYYQRHNVDEVVVQTKHMGSRCNLYLNRDRKLCKAVSRNGYVIKIEGIDKVIDDALEKYHHLLVQEESVILDGELMPWYFLGKGLIEEQYKVVSYGIQSEQTQLAIHGFYDLLWKTVDEAKTNGFSLQDSRKDRQAKYGAHKNSVYEAAFEVYYHPFELASFARIYDNQIKLFGQESPPHFIPFAILAWGDKNLLDPDYHWTNIDNAHELDFPTHLYRTDDEKAIKELDEKLENMDEEGYVVKPNPVYLHKVAPYIKVRNPRYLTLVYGYDYLKPKKINKLMKQKNINQKLLLSIKEYDAGRKMLDFKEQEIGNEEYMRVALSLISIIEQEKELDPRL